MDFISRHQLQDNRISEILGDKISRGLPIIQYLFIVLVQIHACCRLIIPKDSELEVVGAFDWRCEETYNGE